MMRFIDQHELEPGGVEFGYAVSGNNALYARHCDVCSSSRMHGSHLDLDSFGRVCIGAMSGGLFYQLLSMSQNQSLIRCRCARFYAVNKLCEDNLLSLVIYLSTSQ